MVNKTSKGGKSTTDKISIYTLKPNISDILTYSSGTILINPADFAKTQLKNFSPC
jgi:hypothetical protein